MISFLRTHNLISQDQFGFLSRRSACTQLLITLNNWTLNVDNGMKVDVVTLILLRPLTLSPIRNYC